MAYLILRMCGEVIAIRRVYKSQSKTTMTLPNPAWLMMVVVSLVLASIVMLYFYVRHAFSYWARRGVAGPPPSLLTLGNATEFFRKSPFEMELPLLERYGRLYGLYQGLRPVLTVADAGLAKQLMVRDFHLFVDTFQTNTHHEIANRILFMARADRWKPIRAATSPIFSTARLRAMAPMMGRSADKLCQALLVKHDKSSQGSIEMDTRTVMVRFSLDVIASTVFGLVTDDSDSSSNSNQSQPAAGDGGQQQQTEANNNNNPFLHNAIKLFDMNALNYLAILVLPRWANRWFTRVDVPLNQEAWTFFEHLGREVLRKRLAGESPNRNDLLDLLIRSRRLELELEQQQQQQQVASSETEGQKSQLGTGLSENEIIAQAIGFLIGGFDTAAATLTHACYELACNPSVEEELHRELSTTLTITNEKPLGSEDCNIPHYTDQLLRLPYLEAVIRETLRKYPPFARAFRMLDPNHRGESWYQLTELLRLEPGQLVEVSILAMHYDAEYFPEPFRFRPERFLAEGHLVHPYAYLPFSQGPRNCIGLRFAMQEMKIALAKLVTRFRVLRTERTPPPPLTFQPYKFILNSEGPLELRFEPRTQQ